MKHKIDLLSLLRPVHFIGIGGIGMSALAHILLKARYKVSGTDLRRTNIINKLEASGAKIFIGHSASNICDDIGLVVYSSSISEDNPELRQAKMKNIPIIHRGDLLAYFVNSKKGIAVTGAHGKTTTTALVSMLFMKAGLDPTILVGAEVDDFGGNAVYGEGNYVIAEADESDGSFLKLKPFYEIITNIDMEHLDYYKDFDRIKQANQIFVENIKKDGCLFYNAEDENLKGIAANTAKRSRCFGMSEKADIFPRNVRMEGFCSTFECFYHQKYLSDIQLNVPGAHNILNSLAVILVGLEAGIKTDVIKSSLECYHGAKRRFQVKGVIDGVTVVEDYAHHPTEIRAVLNTCRAIWGHNKRIISIFQPHRFTRTMFLSDEFAKSLSASDKVILTDIYSAHETPIEGVSIKNIYDKTSKYNMQDVRILAKGDIISTIISELKRDDVVLVLGAGDIGEVSDELVDILKKRS